MKIQIKARITDAILFEREISDDTPERHRTREALQKAVSARANLAHAYLARAYLARADLARANLADADLADADLAGADLAGANLAGADLAGAYLAGAYLAGADLAGAKGIEFAKPEEAIANLDRVREIILDNPGRLYMGHWHDDESKWQEHTCAEEAMCGTTHCLAGWLQVCSTDEKIRALDNPELAGIICAPVASKMFYENEKRVMDWLKDRKYAEAKPA